MIGTYQNLENLPDQVLPVAVPTSAANLHPRNRHALRRTPAAPYVVMRSPRRLRRPTKCLTARQVQGLFDAAAHAKFIGAPLNRHVIISLRDAPGRAQDALGCILERVSKWGRYRGLQMAWLWTLEYGHRHGVHVHLLMHTRRGSRTALLGELRKLVRGVLRAKRLENTTIRFKRVGRLGTKVDKGVLHYVCKNCSPIAARRFAIDPSPHAAILGKRCGTSENIGPSARRSSSNGS